MTEALLGFGAIFLLAFLRVPLAFALLSVSLGGISVVMGWDVARSLVPLTISEAVFSYELAVVPMFILMGNILARTGISDDLFSASNAFLGPVRGGLALSTMVTCAGFSAVCGSSLATAATMSKVAYPSMKRYCYSDSLAAATIAAGGTLGILIPPSINMIIYAVLTDTSVADLYAAGFIPGFLLAGLLVSVVVAQVGVQRGVVRPLQRLLHATDELAEGRYVSRTPATGLQELTELGRRFTNDVIGLFLRD